jgi:hypothetical protein
MNVLIACEYSGTVRDAFIRAGHNAISCDILPTEAPGPHHQGDVREYLTRSSTPLFDLLIAHPPCTRLTNAGVRWLGERNLWEEMRQGAAFFNWFQGPFLNIERRAIENPIMHRYARELCGDWTQTIQPWQFGEPQFKRTCLWLQNLPPLVPTLVLDPPKAGTDEHKAWSKVHRCPPGVDRAKIRSAFFPGIADAMAAQWGSLT